MPLENRFAALETDDKEKDEERKEDTDDEDEVSDDSQSVKSGSKSGKSSPKRRKSASRGSASQLEERIMGVTSGGDGGDVFPHNFLWGGSSPPLSAE